MRIAVSGTHSVGKSTLVADIHKSIGKFVHEEEPYRALRDLYPIKFGKESTRYCNGIQCFYNISRVQQYRSARDHVIFDRCPIDYIAYSIYTAHHKQTDLDMAFVQSLVEPVRESLAFLDAVVFVPVTQKHPIHLEDDGIRLVDKEYRWEVDRHFKRIYRDGLYDLFGSKGPRLVEVTGSREERIDQLRSLLA
ncbi:MAG: AAA family ATPase [Enhydrobacter sp.]|nr:MAG: AAA family ATPase [Enhydrobacter sp.]